MGRKEHPPLQRYKAYAVVFLSTFAVWIGVSMSDTTTLRTAVAVEWNGYDTARYAVVSADTTLAVDLQANGWQMLRLNFVLRHTTLRLDVDEHLPHGQATSVATGWSAYELAPFCAERLGLPSQAVTVADSARLRLTARRRKGFVPRLDQVSYTFASRCGLAGAPRLQPDSVYLYGSAEALAAIDHLDAEAYTIANIDHSGNYRIDLQPVWKDYRDLWVSTSSIMLYIPVERYALASQTVPIRLLHADTSDVIRLYPTEVEVSYFVADDSLGVDFSRRLTATVDFSRTDETDQLPVELTFPPSLRISNVNPSYVHYVVIK